ncbi:uncharacterized protein [Zea mays]|uniref:uncharacterized protein isoform X2 n=1 Tax=Zea mays TaxID=4577 RepID=UPI0009A9AEF0|nr:uncharacterized protein LOC100275467 isoform X2 [Zea mays]|eukprot:XP_020394215.1 uncharacterized protein LOC100275467 isoform X2 [Zea mays]
MWGKEQEEGRIRNLMQQIGEERRKLSYFEGNVVWLEVQKHTDLIGLGSCRSRTRLHSPQVELPGCSALVRPSIPPPVLALTDAGKCNQIKEVAVYTSILIYLLAGTATSWFPTFKGQYSTTFELNNFLCNLTCSGVLFFKKGQVMRCSPPIWVTNVTSLLLKIMSVHAVSTSKDVLIS